MAVDCVSCISCILYKAQTSSADDLSAARITDSSGVKASFALRCFVLFNRIEASHSCHNIFWCQCLSWITFYHLCNRVHRAHCTINSRRTNCSVPIFQFYCCWRLRKLFFDEKKKIKMEKLEVGEQMNNVRWIPMNPAVSTWQHVQIYFNILNHMLIFSVAIYMTFLCVRAGNLPISWHAWLCTIGVRSVINSFWNHWK